MHLALPPKRLNKGGLVRSQSHVEVLLKKYMRTFTRDEVAKNSTEASAWIIIDSSVYDITKFASLHPGGELLILEYAGKDATGNHGIVLNQIPRGLP
jgi:cytochrome b involved in lipid metabolism